MTSTTIKDPHHPTRQELLAIDIHTLLPQQEPFVMVGQLTSYDATSASTLTTLTASSLLAATDGTWTEGAMIENIAQSCAARIGYVNRYILHRDVAAGVIAAIKSMTIVRRPLLSEAVATTLHIDHEAFGMAQVSATMTIGSEQVAWAEIKMMQ